MSILVIVSKPEIEIVKSWRNTDGCRTIVFPLPYKLAEKDHIEKPAKLYLIPRDDGILLRKVDLEGIMKNSNGEICSLIESRMSETIQEIK